MSWRARSWRKIVRFVGRSPSQDDIDMLVEALDMCRGLTRRDCTLLWDRYKGPMKGGKKR